MTLIPTRSALHRIFISTAWNVLIEKYDMSTPLARPRRRWQSNIKWNLEKRSTKMWTGFTWLAIRHIQWYRSVYHVSGGTSWLAEWLYLLKKGLSSRIKKMAPPPPLHYYLITPHYILMHKICILLTIYLLTVTGLTPGGSSTVHIYTQTIHRTTQLKQYTEQHN